MCIACYAPLHICYCLVHMLLPCTPATAIHTCHCHATCYCHAHLLLPFFLPAHPPSPSCLPATTLPAYPLLPAQGGLCFKEEDRSLGLRIGAQFVEVVNLAPMAVLKEAYDDVGGFDETMSDPGSCGVWGDWWVGLTRPCLTLGRVVMPDLGSVQGTGGWYE